MASSKKMRMRRETAIGLLAMMICLGTCAQAQRPQHPRKTVTVASDGSGDFKDVQSAVSSWPEGNLVVRIKPGVYRQVVQIAGSNVELRGLGARPEDVVLTFDNSHGTAGGTSKSASTTVTGDGFLAENLTFENSFSREHPDAHGDTQAVALLVTGDREVFRHVRLIGAQDTLYANSKNCHSPEEVSSGEPCRASRQYFADCYIEGHVDFIFGDAKAVFDHCEIHAIAHPITTITAQSRVYPAEDSGYLFLDCTVTGSPGATDILLGRPWRAYSTVIFLNTEFKAKLNPAGWADWDARLKTSDYAEYNSHGQSGDLRERIAGSRQLTAAEAAKDTVRTWLDGTDGWNPQDAR